MENKLINIYFSFEKNKIPPSAFCISEEHYQAILWELENHRCDYETKGSSSIFRIIFKEDVGAFELSLITSIEMDDTTAIQDLLERYRSNQSTTHKDQDFIDSCNRSWLRALELIK